MNFHDIHWGFVQIWLFWLGSMMKSCWTFFFFFFRRFGGLKSERFWSWDLCLPSSDIYFNQEGQSFFAHNLQVNLLWNYTVVKSFRVLFSFSNWILFLRDKDLAFLKFMYHRFFAPTLTSIIQNNFSHAHSLLLIRAGAELFISLGREDLFLSLVLQIFKYSWLYKRIAPRFFLNKLKYCF